MTDDQKESLKQNEPENFLSSTTPGIGDDAGWESTWETHELQRMLKIRRSELCENGYKKIKKKKASYSNTIRTL